MTDQQRAAMQMALKALNAMLTHMGMDEDDWNKPTFDQAREAITALREALAQENKPHIVRDGGNWGMSPRYKCSACDEEFRSEHRAHWHCQNECKALAQSTNSCQNSTKLVETEQSQSTDLSFNQRSVHRYAGSFGE